MAKDRWSMGNTPDNATPVSRRTPVLPVQAGSQRTSLSEDLPVKIIYQSGREITFTEEMTSTYGPLINAVIIPVAKRNAETRERTARRFWRLNLPVDRPIFFDDGQIINRAKSVGLDVSDPVEAAKAMNFVARYFLVDETGEPIKKDNGRWIEADPADYRPAPSNPPTT